MGEVHEEAENDDMLGMKYKEIAEKYGKDDNKLSSEQLREKEREVSKMNQAKNLATQTRDLMNKYSGIKYKN